MTVLDIIGDITVIVTRTPEEWVAVIKADLSHTIEGIVSTGRHLIEAKADLNCHGSWLRMLADVGIDYTAAKRFMAIARHPTLTNRAHVPHLPSSYSTLYQLSRLEPAALEAAIEDGTVSPDIKRRQVAALLNPDIKPLRELPQKEGEMAESATQIIGRRNQKQQVRALGALASDLEVKASVLEGLFLGGIQKTCGPEIRDRKVAEIRAAWRRINSVLKQITAIKEEIHQ